MPACHFARPIAPLFPVLRRPARLLSTAPSHVDVAIPGELTKARLHPAWLRDHCQCAECVHPSTQQKLHDSGRASQLAKVSHAETRNDALNIRWHDGHTSVFPLEWLRRCAPGRRPTLEPLELWERATLPAEKLRWTYDAIANDDGALGTLVSALHRYGLVFVDRLPAGPVNIVEQLAERLGPIQETFYGRSWDVRSVPQARNIAYTDLALGLHMDLMYFEAPPGAQLLHCLANSVTGGESVFLDIFSVVERLRAESPQHYRTLTEVPVTFRYRNDGHHLEFRRPTIAEDPLATLGWPYRVFYSPPFQGPLDSVDPARVGAFYDAMAALQDLVDDHERRYTHTTLLRSGTCVIFNNRRVLHGRAAFDASSGIRHLRGTYVCWDAILDRYRVLGGLAA